MDLDKICLLYYHAVRLAIRCSSVNEKLAIRNGATLKIEIILEDFHGHRVVEVHWTKLATKPKAMHAGDAY